MEVSSPPPSSPLPIIPIPIADRVEAALVRLASTHPDSAPPAPVDIVCSSESQDLPCTSPVPEQRQPVSPTTTFPAPAGPSLVSGRGVSPCGLGDQVHGDSPLSETPPFNSPLPSHPQAQDVTDPDGPSSTARSSVYTLELHSPVRTDSASFVPVTLVWRSPRHHQAPLCLSFQSP